MTQKTNQKQERKTISAEEFDKKVVIAMAHYEYFGYMSRAEAKEKAFKEVSGEYVVAQKH